MEYSPFADADNRLGDDLVSQVVGPGATAAMNGTVLDPSGLAVAGAKVTLKNPILQPSRMLSQMWRAGTCSWH